MAACAERKHSGRGEGLLWHRDQVQSDQKRDPLYWRVAEDGIVDFVFVNLHVHADPFETKNGGARKVQKGLSKRV
jgi:hypothetical protein